MAIQLPVILSAQHRFIVERPCSLMTCSLTGCASQRWTGEPCTRSLAQSSDARPRPTRRTAPPSPRLWPYSARGAGGVRKVTRGAQPGHSCLSN
ncbi:hypothetical protein SKAU_G00189160 [Synaphobranchus kaupii]|uniref:Uncharacterized protein n=1 Tax=Synaphobranchus kaupii TaxID=118154 RepID=A0A9Q1IV10_SYNKA|nr:hypothetical protein SKAU_G00189160 [Synaphobranchus kaupii]